MNYGVLNRLHGLQIPTSIVLMLHLLLIMVQSIAPDTDDQMTKSPGDVRIVPQTFFGNNQGWLKVKQYDEGAVGKIAHSCKAAPSPESRSHSSVVLTGFPSEKTPSFQKSILYTLQTSSDL